VTAYASRTLRRDGRPPVETENSARFAGSEAAGSTLSYCASDGLRDLSRRPEAHANDTNANNSHTTNGRKSMSIKTGKTSKAAPSAAKAKEGPKVADLDCGEIPCDDGRPMNRAAVRTLRRRLAISMGLALINVIERGISAYAEEAERELQAADRAAREAKRRTKGKTGGKARPKAAAGK